MTLLYIATACACERILEISQYLWTKVWSLLFWSTLCRDTVSTIAMLVVWL